MPDVVQAHSEREQLSAHLQRFISAKSFALIGASNDQAKWGFRILSNLIGGGFQGRVYPVNRKETEILGHKAYPDIASLPEVPDIALIALPASQAVQALDEIGRFGVRSVVVITAGFAEAGNRQGEEDLVAVSRKWGMALVGPNCMGFFSSRANMHALMSNCRPNHGGVSFVSQSGNVGTEAMLRSHLHGVGFSLMFSMGNSAVLDSDDYLHFLADDPGTQVIAMYLEGVRHGEDFLDALRYAARRKPVVVTKGGRSAPGFRAASSHSAALATPEAIFSSLVRQAGGTLAGTVEEMMDVATALDLAPLPRGSRVGILTWGGGWGVLAADACADNGMEVPPLSDATRAALDQLLPSFWSKDNPVDLVGSLDHTAHMKILKVMAEAEEFDALIVLGLLSSPDPYNPNPNDLMAAVHMYWGAEVTEEMVRLAKELGKPMIGVTISGGMAPPPEAEGRLPVYPTPDRAVKAAARLVDYSRYLARKSEPPAEIAVDRDKVAALLASAPSGTKLSERESLEILAAYGIPTVSCELVDSEQQAMEAARRLGFPVVLKAGGRGIAHKTERGLVAAGIADAGGLSAAWASINCRLGPGEKAEGLMIQPMLSSTREFTLGVVRDPAFGPCVMFGMGGIYAEALKDVAFRRALLSLEDAQDMMDEVRAGALLSAMRGQPAVDCEALAWALVRLGKLALDFPQIAELDVNPILVPEGRPVAADALIVIG
ncbi:MAG: acetate--CoA ligase family protein [Actinomycetota bacterium]